MTPLWTVRDVCTYARCHRSKVDRATALLRTSKGRKGLPYQQSGPGCPLRFRQSDVERWVAGEAPDEPTTSRKKSGGPPGSSTAPLSRRTA